MARPQKSGLDYFPLNVDMDQDDKVMLIESEFGIVGFGIIVKMLCKIYSNGYFYEWGEKEQLLFSKRINVDKNEVIACINSAIKWDLFDQDIYIKYNVLTSQGIQKRFIEAVGRRKTLDIVEEYWLIDIPENEKMTVNIINVDINSVNVDINEKIVDINSQSKVKKRKVKESKVNQSKKEEEISVDDDNLFTFLESNFGRTISPIELEQVMDWEKDFNDEIIKYAITLCCNNNAKNINYLNAILNSWKSKGFTKIEECKNESNKRKDNKSYKNQQPVREEIVPEWINQNIKKEPYKMGEDEKTDKLIESMAIEYGNTSAIEMLKENKKYKPNPELLKKLEKYKKDTKVN